MAKKPDRSVAITLIAIFKLLKAVLLIVVGITALKLMNNNLTDTITHWANKLHIAPGNKYLKDLLSHSLNISPKNLEVIGIATFAYAAMFGTEGIGLAMGKRWAEYMVVITTAGLMPFEIYEIWEHRNGIKIGALVINAAAVVYLILRLWKSKDFQAGPSGPGKLSTPVPGPEGPA